MKMIKQPTIPPMPKQPTFDARDTQYNLPIGTDCISRQQAIDALDRIFDRCEEIEAHLPEDDPDRTGYKMYPDYMTVWKYLHQLPSAPPEIIYCKDCSKHNKRIGDYVENSDGTYYWIWKGQACPLAEFRGVAQGHEFDYQFCAYGERRTE